MSADENVSTDHTPDSSVAPPAGDERPQENTSTGEERPRESRPEGERPRDDKPRDTVFIGKKPLMAYVTLTLLQLAELPSVNIRARGMSISRAVDVAQIISRKRDNAVYTIGAIELDSEVLQSTDGKQRNVSTINISISRS